MTTKGSRVDWNTIVLFLHKPPSLKWPPVASISNLCFRQYNICFMKYTPTLRMEWIKLFFTISEFNSTIQYLHWCVVVIFPFIFYLYIITHITNTPQYIKWVTENIFLSFISTIFKFKIDASWVRKSYNDMKYFSVIFI